MTAKTILITGATGFIGRHLVSRFADRGGPRVRCLVRRSTPRYSLLEHPLVEYCIGDVTDAREIQPAVTGCDTIIHTAALQPFRPLPSRNRFYMVNVEGTLNLLRACAPADIGRFVLLSTINVHGLPPPLHADADSPLVGTRDRYTDSKAEGEAAARVLARQRDIPFTVIRPACTFGPGSTAWTLQPIDRIRHGTRLLIGDGSGLCNPVYIENLIDLIVSAVESDAAAGEAFIGSDGIGTPWREFYGHYARLLGRPLRRIPYLPATLAAQGSDWLERLTGLPGPLPGPSFRFYTHRTVFDVSKNKRLLGHTPRISFQEGMERTLAWVRQARIV